MSYSSPSQPAAAASTRLYRAIWRWHFYAGLLVVPFMIVLSITGLIMVYGNSIESFLGPKHVVAATGERASSLHRPRRRRSPILAAR